MIVVSDTTPLNYLVLIDAIDILPKLLLTRKSGGLIELAVSQTHATQLTHTPEAPICVNLSVSNESSAL